MYQFNLAKDLKEHKKSFPLNLKFTTDLNCLTTTCQQKASCPASCQLDGWALRLMTTEFAYIETPLYHLKNAIGHDYSIWMDYKLPEYWTYSSWCFFRYFYYQESNSASCYHSIFWAETKLSTSGLIIDSSCFWLASIHSMLPDLGTTSPYF